MSVNNRWWSISESALYDALVRANAGEHPAVILAELIANSTTEDYSGEEDPCNDH